MQLAMTRAKQALGGVFAVLLSAYDVSRDRLYGHIKKRKDVELVYRLTLRQHCGTVPDPLVAAR